MAWRSCGLFGFANSCCPVYGSANNQEGGYTGGEIKVYWFHYRSQGIYTLGSRDKVCIQQSSDVVFDKFIVTGQSRRLKHRVELQVFQQILGQREWSSWR